MTKLLALVLMLTATAIAQSPSDKVSAILNDWHKAAAAADEARYFSHFAPNAVFMGTDATERWPVKEFRAWAHPHFQSTKTWDFKPRDRHVDFSADGKTAWFDEILDTGSLGPCRGSGVLVLLSGQWKIAQYNLSVPIPNSIASAVVKEIAAAGK